MVQGPHDERRHLGAGDVVVGLEGAALAHHPVGAGGDAQLIDGAHHVVDVGRHRPADIAEVVLDTLADTVHGVQLDLAGAVLVLLQRVGQIVDDHRVRRQVQEREDVLGHVGPGHVVVGIEGSSPCAPP